LRLLSRERLDADTGHLVSLDDTAEDIAVACRCVDWAVRGACLLREFSMKRFLQILSFVATVGFLYGSIFCGVKLLAKWAGY
jgi:hypothetical protein